MNSRSSIGAGKLHRDGRDEDAQLTLVNYRGLPIKMLEIEFQASKSGKSIRSWRRLHYPKNTTSWSSIHGRTKLHSSRLLSLIRPKFRNSFLAPRSVSVEPLWGGQETKTNTQRCLETQSDPARTIRPDLIPYLWNYEPIRSSSAQS